MRRAATAFLRADSPATGDSRAGVCAADYAVKASLLGVAISLTRSKTPAWETSASERSDDILTAGRGVGTTPRHLRPAWARPRASPALLPGLSEVMMNAEVIGTAVINTHTQPPSRCSALILSILSDT